MTIGIEQFRNLTNKSDLENRRVTVDQQTQEVTAPKSLWGRILNWVRGTENRGDRGVLNQQTREAFYNALVKSSNPEFAEKVIKRVYGEQVTGQGFKERTTNLQVSRIKQILDTARDMRLELRMHNERALEQHIGNGNLGSVVETMARGKFSSLGQAALIQAKQVVTVGVNLAPREFLVEALRRSEQHEQKSKLVHVNIGLSTADPSGRRLDRRDGDLIQHQIDSFGRLNGNDQMLSVRYEGDELDQDFGDDVIAISEHKLVAFDIDTINFSFAVSGDKIGSTRFDELDRQSMVKLVGDLAIGSAPGGYVGGVIDDLRKRRDESTSETERQQIDDLIGRIQREVDTARELFTTGSYKDVSVDPYKMARTVMRVVDLTGEGLRLSGQNGMHMSLSESSRTSYGGTSVLDIEHKSQVIIEDMGGRVQPMRLDMSNRNDEERIIFNTVLTSSGDVEVRGQHTGLRGLGDTRDISGRSRDIEALTYAQGLTERDRPDPNQR